MLLLGVLAGRNLPSAWAETTVCGSYRFQTIELTNPRVEVIDGETDEDLEVARWTDAELTPARVHEIGGVEMPDDDRLLFDFDDGETTDLLTLVPTEGQ